MHTVKVSDLEKGQKVYVQLHKQSVYTNCQRKFCRYIWINHYVFLLNTFLYIYIQICNPIKKKAAA